MVQCSVNDSLSANWQQHTVQSVKEDSIRYRLEEMKDVLLQHELRLEVQMTEPNTQTNTLSARRQTKA